jgi:hypothetical protein
MKLTADPRPWHSIPNIGNQGTAIANHGSAVIVNYDGNNNLFRQNASDIDCTRFLYLRVPSFPFSLKYLILHPTVYHSFTIVLSFSFVLYILIFEKHWFALIYNEKNSS